MDPIPLPAESVAWLRRLADAREHNEGGWLDEPPPGKPAEALLVVGIVQRGGSSYRLTDIGWWLLQRVPGLPK